MKNAALTSGLLATMLLVLACGQIAHAEDKMILDTDDQNIIKRSRANICHDKNDASFENTVHFRAYRTMQDCLDSGGKPSKN